MNGNYLKRPSRCTLSARLLLEQTSESGPRGGAYAAHHLGCQPRPVSRLLHQFSLQPVSLQPANEPSSPYDKHSVSNLPGPHDSEADGS